MHGFLSVLNSLNRHSRLLLALGVFLGIGVPPLASWLNPFAVPAVLGCLVGALLLLDWSGLGAQLRRPQIIIALLCWQLLLSPLIAWWVGIQLNLSPTLQELILLQCAAAPSGSAAVFLMLIGLNGGMALLVSALAVLALPATLTIIMAWLAQHTFDVGLGDFFIRACLMVLAPLGCAVLIRKLAGLDRIRRHGASIGGANVALLIVFAIGVMDGVTQEIIARPQSAAILFMTAWIVAIILHLSAFAAFSWAGTQVAYSAAVLSGNRNMGLMLAITAGLSSYEFQLYVGIAQIPMYCVPLLLAPLVRRSLSKEASISGKAL